MNGKEVVEEMKSLLQRVEWLAEELDDYKKILSKYNEEKLDPDESGYKALWETEQLLSRIRNEDGFKAIGLLERWVQHHDAAFEDYGLDEYERAENDIYESSRELIRRHHKRKAEEKLAKEQVEKPITFTITSHKTKEVLYTGTDREAAFDACEAAEKQGDYGIISTDEPTPPPAIVRGSTQRGRDAGKEPVLFRYCCSMCDWKARDGVEWEDPAYCPACGAVESITDYEREIADGH